MLADATYEITSEQATNKLTLPSDGYRLDAKEIIERKVIFAPYAQLAEAADGFGHNLFVLDSDGPLRHMNPFVRTNDRAIPSLGVAGALRAAGIRPAQVRFEGDSLVLGDRRMPLTERTVRSPNGITTYKWSPINFRGPALLDDLQSRPYSSYSFWNLFLSEDQILRDEKPQVAPSEFHDKIVFVGADRVRPVRRVRNAVPAAGCPASRSTPPWPTTCCRTGS